MTGRHRALIVEDDRPIAEELQEILRALNFDSVIVDSKRDALATLKEDSFCLVLLDLQIKSGPDSIKGHTEHGRSLLLEIRRAHAEHTGACYWLPILVVSGFAAEVPVAVEIMRDGANDLIQKPLGGRAVSEKVRGALERSGRVAHDDCSAGFVMRVPGDSTNVAISVPGDREDRRTRVLVGSRVVMLQNRPLKVLLRLMIAHASGTNVHKVDLGKTEQNGSKGVNVLREALKPVLGAGGDIVINKYHGYYCLAEHVTVAEVAADKLALNGDGEIADLSRQLEILLEGSTRKV